MPDLIQPSRRRFITGLVTLIAAPAIVRAASLMPVRALPVLEEENRFEAYTTWFEHQTEKTSIWLIRWQNAQTLRALYPDELAPSVFSGWETGKAYDRRALP